MIVMMIIMFIFKGWGVSRWGQPILMMINNGHYDYDDDHHVHFQGVGRKQVGTLSDVCCSLFTTDGMEPDLIRNKK